MHTAGASLWFVVPSSCQIHSFFRQCYLASEVIALESVKESVKYRMWTDNITTTKQSRTKVVHVLTGIMHSLGFRCDPSLYVLMYSFMRPQYALPIWRVTGTFTYIRHVWLTAAPGCPGRHANIAICVYTANLQDSSERGCLNIGKQCIIVAGCRMFWVLQVRPYIYIYIYIYMQDWRLIGGYC